MFDPDHFCTCTNRPGTSRTKCVRHKCSGVHVSGVQMFRCPRCPSVNVPMSMCSLMAICVNVSILFVAGPNVR